jgi:hypothetical protein
MIAFMPAGLAIGKLKAEGEKSTTRPYRHSRHLGSVFFVRNYLVDPPGSDSGKCQRVQRHR